jgi:RimJ/RimL family protein N-acetyltransferase
MTFPVEIIGPRLRLREVDVGNDLDGALAIAGDEEVTRLMMFEPQTRDSERAALTAMMERARLAERHEWDLVAELVDGNGLVGMGRIGLTDGAGVVADIGYVVRRDAWGNGYGTEIASLLVRFGFTVLGVHRIWATTHPDNRASQRVLEGVGMTYEGRMREHVFAHGTWRDSLVYAVLEHEWPGTSV